MKTETEGDACTHADYYGDLWWNGACMDCGATRPSIAEGRIASLEAQLKTVTEERDKARAELNIGAFLAAGDDDDTLKVALAQLKTAREALARKMCHDQRAVRNMNPSYELPPRCGVCAPCLAREALSTPTPSTDSDMDYLTKQVQRANERNRPATPTPSTQATMQAMIDEYPNYEEMDPLRAFLGQPLYLDSLSTPTPSPGDADYREWQRANEAPTVYSSTPTPSTEEPEEMPGTCAMCGAPDNVHRVLDSIVGRVIAGDSIASTVDDFGTYSPREVWLMVTAVLSSRLEATRSPAKTLRLDQEWRDFLTREGDIPRGPSTEEESE